MAIPIGHNGHSVAGMLVAFQDAVTQPIGALGNALRVALKAATHHVRLAQCRITTIFTSLSTDWLLLEPLSA